MANKQYLLSLSSGNIAPITLERGDSYVDIDTNIDALFNFIKDGNIAPRYRIFILNNDDTIQSEIPPQDIIMGGSFSENYQQGGQRCSLSFALYNQNGKYTPNINKFWVGTKLRFDAGIEQQDGAILWVQKGVFVINSAQPSYTAESKTVSISAGDKFANLEGNSGTLSTTYEIPTNSKIKEVISSLLLMQKGDGSVYDLQPPYFHPSLVNKRTQAKITKGAGDNIGSLIIELANQLSAEVFYNAQGRMCFLPLNEVSDDNDKPIMYNFIAEQGDFTDLNFSLDYSNIINRIVLIGATINGGVVKATASNDDPFSPLCVQRIGARTSVINQSDIKTKIVAEENARYQLRKQLILKTNVNLSVSFNPLCAVNNLAMVTDDFYGLLQQYFLIQSVSFNLDYSPTMSISVSNVNNLPFISAYRSEEYTEKEDVDKTADLLSYAITVDYVGTVSGPKTILKGGTTTIILVPNAGQEPPTEVVVQGAVIKSYDQNTGVLVLTQPYKNVIVSSGMPSGTLLDYNGLVFISSNGKIFTVSPSS